MVNMNCDKCGKPLKRKILTKQEILEKVNSNTFRKEKTLKFLKSKWIVEALEKGYDYLQCSNCNWGKWVKKGELPYNENGENELNAI
jgi:hypothetical protein